MANLFIGYSSLMAVVVWILIQFPFITKCSITRWLFWSFTLGGLLTSAHFFLLMGGK